MKNLITRAETMKKLFSVRLVLAATLSLMLFGDLVAQQVPDATRLRQEQQEKVDDIFESFNDILASVKTLTEEHGLERLEHLIEFVQVQFLTDASKELVKKLLMFQMSVSGSYNLPEITMLVSSPSSFTNTGRVCGPFTIGYTNHKFGFKGYSAKADLEFNISEADVLVNLILDQFILILDKLEDELAALVQVPTLEESHEQMFRFNLVSVPYLEAIIEGLGQDLVGENIKLLSVPVELLKGVLESLEKDMAFRLGQVKSKADLRDSIENNLIGHGMNPYPIAAHVLPEAKGGHLELVQEIVQTTIDKMVKAGVDIYDARDLFSMAIEQQGMGSYKEAYYYYSFAYTRATGIKINEDPTVGVEQNQ